MFMVIKDYQSSITRYIAIQCASTFTLKMSLLTTGVTQYDSQSIT